MAFGCTAFYSAHSALACWLKTDFPIYWESTVYISVTYSIEYLFDKLFLRGLTPVSDDEVQHLYEGTHVPVEDMNNYYGKVNLKLSDLFELI